jgi:ethanolamine utilization protein EutN/carbon dioxide concentrating mechanism protein CcmL
MKLGKIIGQVIATQKAGIRDGLRLSVVQYLDDKIAPKDKSAICIDTVKSKIGDVVLLCSSSSARMTQLTKYVCTDNTIVGIVDKISYKKDYIYLNNNFTIQKDK